MPISGRDLILPGAGIAGQVITGLFQGGANRANRRFARQMYERQRADSLVDWNMMNEYNSPRSQMQRYQEAGLSPHLIYGQTSEGATVRSSSVPQGNAKASDFDLATPFMNIYDMRIKSAQADNLAVQNEVLRQDAILKAISGLKVAADIDTSRFDLDLKRSLRANTLLSAEANLQNMLRTGAKIEADTKYTLNQDERAAAMNSVSIQEAMARITSMRVTNAKTDQERKNLQVVYENLKKDGVLKDWDIWLRQKGIHPGDPGWWRVLNKVNDKISTMAGDMFGKGAVDNTNRETFMRGWLGESWKDSLKKYDLK